MFRVKRQFPQRRPLAVTPIQSRPPMKLLPSHHPAVSGLVAFRRFPRWTQSAWCILLLLAGTASAQQKIEFKDHPFFKRLIGEWSSEGERKYADGNLVKVTETWKTELSGENAVTMEGTRDRA